MIRVVSSVLLSILLVSPGFPQGFDSLTVDKAVSAALQSSLSLKQAEAQIRASEARVRQNESGYFPMVDATADFMRIGPIPEFSFAGLDLPLAPINNIDIHIRASELVYDFGKRTASIDVVRLGVKLTMDNKRSITSSLTVKTMLSFYLVMMLERSVAVQEQQVQALNEHLAITRKRVESGSATEFDALTTAVRVSQAQSAKIDLEHALKDQQVTLLRLTGMSWDAMVCLSGSFEAEPLREGLEMLLDSAKNRRPDLIAARDARDNAALQEQLASLDDAASLRVFASYGLTNGYEPNLEVVRGNLAAGIGVNVPIFNGFKRRGKEEEAAALVNAAERTVEDLTRNAEAEVRQGLSAVTSARDKIAMTELQTHQAESAVENARVRYESGTGTNLDLLDAETNVASARLQGLQARFQYVVARIGLEASTGAFAR